MIEYLLLFGEFKPIDRSVIAELSDSWDAASAKWDRISANAKLITVAALNWEWRHLGSLLQRSKDNESEDKATASSSNIGEENSLHTSSTTSSSVIHRQRHTEMNVDEERLQQFKEDIHFTIHR